MRILKLMFVCVCLVGLTQLVWGENPQLSGEKKAARGIPGYLDPRTDTFTTKAQSPDAKPQTLTDIVARLIFPIDINYNDQPTAVIACTVDISTYDSSGLYYSESSSVIATKSGTSATCTVTILFEWALASPTTDTISVEYHIEGLEAFTVGSAAPVVESVRSSDHSLPSIPVPTNGQTITEPTTYTYF